MRATAQERKSVVRNRRRRCHDETGIAGALLMVLRAASVIARHTRAMSTARSITPAGALQAVRGTQAVMRRGR